MAYSYVLSPPGGKNMGNFIFKENETWEFLMVLTWLLYGTLEIKENEAEIVRLIFDYYLAGASLGKVVDMLYKKQIPSPTGKAKWTRAAVDHLLSNSKYIAVGGFESFTDVQFEKSARCNVDYDTAGSPRKSTRYSSPSMLQI